MRIRQTKFNWFPATAANPSVVASKPHAATKVATPTAVTAIAVTVDVIAAVTQVATPVVDWD